MGLHRLVRLVSVNGRIIVRRVRPQIIRLFPERPKVPLRGLVMGNDEYGRMYGGTPPTNATDTSQLAGAKVKAKAPTKREALYAYFEARGYEGSTDYETENGTGRTYSQFGPRRRELTQFTECGCTVARQAYCAHGKPPLVRDSGRRREVQTGEKQIVFVASKFDPPPGGPVKVEDDGQFALDCD